MAETKAEQISSWKQRTSESAAALKKAGATVYHPSTGKSGRTIPTSAQTPSEIRVAAWRAEHPDRVVVDPVTGKHTRIDTRTGTATTISGKPTTLINQMYMGPGTGPGISVSPTITHAQRVMDQEVGQRIADIQQQQFEERLRSPIQTGIGSPLYKVAEPVVKEYEAGISTKPTTTDQPPEYVPTPYIPGTLPEDVKYGERPKFDQPQIHDIIGMKLRELDTYLGEKRVGLDTAVSPHMPDISSLTFAKIASLTRYTPFGVHTSIPDMPYTPEEVVAGKMLHEQYGEFKETPVTTVLDIGTEAAMLLGGGYVLGGLTKVGILGARYATRYGARKAVTKIPDTEVGKIIQKAVMGTEQLIEPAAGAGFGYLAIKDIATTPKEELPHKLYEYTLGFAGAAKGYRVPERMIDIFRVKGRKEISPETIIEPQVLTGAEPFPFVRKGETVPELITRFKGPEYKLPTETPGAPQVWHATSKPFPKEVIVEGGTVRPSDLPGLYVAPSVSPHFLRTGQIKTKDTKLSSFERLFGSSESLTPTLLGVEVPGIGRIPKNLRQSFGASKEYVSYQKKADAIITRDVELAQFGKGKVEAEAVVPPTSKLIRVGTDYYIRIGDRKIPIDKYIAEMHIKGEKKVVLEGKTEPIPRATPDPYYYLPKSTKRGPYYRGDTKPSTGLKDTASEVTAPISEYVPTIPREYMPVGVSDRVPAPRSDVPISIRDYVPSPPSESIAPYVPEYRPPPPKESVIPYIPEDAPPPTITKLKKGPDEKMVFVRKDRLMPGYAWQLANPIATLEQLLGGRTAPRSTRTALRKKTTKKKKKGGQKR